jgi:hypothetical protein
MAGMAGMTGMTGRVGEDGWARTGGGAQKRDGKQIHRWAGALLRMTGRRAQNDRAKKTKRAMCVENKKSSLDVGAVKRRTD